MATVSSPGVISPFNQIKRCFSSLESMVSSVCEPACHTFRRVTVTKSDAQGRVRIFDVRNDRGEVKKSPFLTYIEHVRTGDLQLDEPMSAVSLKCAMIALTAPFYTVGKMSWYLFHTPVRITLIALDTLLKTGEHLALGNLYEGSVAMWKGVSQIPDLLGNGLFEVIKAPLFGLGMELAAIYGIFKPYHGRRFEAIIENAWQQRVSYKEDMRNIPPRPDESFWESGVKDMHSAHPFYLAHCFQIRGNLSDPRFTLIKREHLTH